LLKSWQSDENKWSEAEAELRWVTAANEAGEVRQQELAAQAFSSLGLLKYILGDDNEAIISYERALELEQYARYKARYSEQLSRLYSEKGDAEAATKYAKLASEYDLAAQSEDPLK
jgi:tetratricopeptide (TPR) repeat protein